MEKVEIINTNKNESQIEKWVTVDVSLIKLIDTCSNGRKTKEEAKECKNKKNI